MLPSISFEGTLTKDPTLRFTAEGHAVTTVNVACNDRKQDSNGKWVNGDATYLTCYIYRKMAENVAESLRKGDLVVVSGRYQSRGWEDDNGAKRTAQEVKVESIGLSLRFETIESPKAGRREQTWPTTEEDSAAPF